MNTRSVSLVPLQQASLCLDCETITTAHTNCLACGSRALLNLARVLSQHSSDRLRSVSTAAVPMSLSPIRQRQTFRPGAPNADRRLERTDAAPMRFVIGGSPNRQETYES